jgi:hypothetical protein
VAAAVDLLELVKVIQEVLVEEIQASPEHLLIMPAMVVKAVLKLLGELVEPEIRLVMDHNSTVGMEILEVHLCMVVVAAVDITAEVLALLPNLIPWLVAEAVLDT